MNTTRLATISDAASILDIYTPYILNTAFTFETDIPTIQNFEVRINTYQENWPWLVYEHEGVIAGYAYATKHRERAAYQWCVESSVYVHGKFQQKGIAKLLYYTLLEILKFQSCRTVYAGITLQNDESNSYNIKFDIMLLKDLENIGYKLIRWNTVT